MWRKNSRTIKLKLERFKRERSMSKKFKVGDRVVGIGYQDGVDLTGMIGIFWSSAVIDEYN